MNILATHMEILGTCTSFCGKKLARDPKQCGGSKKMYYNVGDGVNVDDDDDDDYAAADDDDEDDEEDYDVDVEEEEDEV